ncbi:Transcriptional regulator KdgR [Rosistilla ulvae]|uniref:Transcriptional regulator KdgR n=1 Tax=Rosistilla ulvae TaxID=1930277 RepID=A0A517M737_9BACT|nr:IclR family transcriptional regulator [Rosistilla ulvae]QDS90675.1 Transcriptional regulator KdgR [Rosistilla ulvae]
MQTSSLGKAFHVLEVLAGTDGAMPLVEIVGELGYHKPTVHRLLQDLSELGYVARVGKGRYQLTHKLRRMTMGKLHDRLLDIAAPFLHELHKQTGETVNLGCVRGTSVRYLKVLESRHPFRRVVDGNSRDPLYSTALGRALTCQWSDKDWEALIERTKLVALTPQTTVDPQQLLAIHQRAKQEGYVVEQDQTDIGITCIGAPVYEREDVVAAVSVSLPTARVDVDSKRDLIDAVVQTAKQVSAKLAAE